MEKLLRLLPLFLLNSMLERAEVIFGPSSAIYGSDALGGVLHFHTLQPKLADSLSHTFSGSAFTRYARASDEKTVHAHVNLWPPPMGQPDECHGD